MINKKKNIKLHHPIQQIALFSSPHPTDHLILHHHLFPTDRLRGLHNSGANGDHTGDPVLCSHVRDRGESVEGDVHQQPGEASHHRCDGPGGSCA